MLALAPSPYTILEESIPSKRLESAALPDVDKAPRDDNVGNVWSPVFVPDKFDADNVPAK